MSSSTALHFLTEVKNDSEKTYNIKISDETDKENILEGRKRKISAEEKQSQKYANAERKRLADAEYNRTLQEQQYKRLMHVLNRSKFYASYILKKINQNHDIRNCVPEDVQRKLSTDTDNISHEGIKNALSDNSGKDTEEDNNIEFETPNYFNGDLRDYQKEGFNWLKVLYENGVNGILADEMGLGKTIQVIVLLCHLIEKKQDGPYLIAAPLSTIPNWVLEFERFAPKLPIVLFHGTREERFLLRKEIKKKYKITDTYSTYPIVITNFETPIQDKSFVQSLHWRYIIVDEGHRLKNHECLLVSVLKSCKSMNRLLLTGTPLQNNLAELWSLLNFLLPEIFDDLAVFESWFDAKELEYDEGTKKFLKLEEEKHVLSSLREILQPFMLRRVKADVNLSIPPKKEVIVYAPLTKLQHDLYKAVLNRGIHKLAMTQETPIIYEDNRPKRRCTLPNLMKHMGATGLKKETLQSVSFETSDNSTDSDVWEQVKPDNKNDLSIWEQYIDITDLNRDFLINIAYRNKSVMYKKIVNHPYLVYCPVDSVGLPKIDEGLVKSSGKLLVLDAMLAKLKQNGHKVLLFSTMQQILNMIEDYLLMRQYSYTRLDGSTSLEDRKENIKNFNTNPDIFLFLITTRAGGVGLNLCAADTVIVYDSDWNPQMDIQAMARCHRIGQTRPVVIYKFCTKGTVDEAIMKRAEAKRILEKMVMAKKLPSFNIKSKETLVQLRKLLESEECHVVAPEHEVFTEEELHKLLDRSDLYQNSKN